MPRWNIDDVPAFVAIVERNGISAAARQLGVSKSAVSKSLARLEEALGTRLVNRNSRSLSITSEGEAFYHQCTQIMEQVDTADALMAGLTSKPSGPLTVALPPAFAREILPKHLPGFLAEYPRIDLELIVSTQPVDIIRDRIDIAVVVGALEDSGLVTRTLYSGRLLWVTSPGYAAAHALNSDLDELLSHLRICETRYAGRSIPVRAHDHRSRLDLGRHILRVNDPVTVREAVLQGLGVSLLPDQYCRAHLRAGTLVEVYPHIELDESAAALSLVYPGRRLVSSRTRAFADFLTRICREI